MVPILLFHSGIADLGYVVRIFHELNLARKWESIMKILQCPIDETLYAQDEKSRFLYVIVAWLRGRCDVSLRPSWSNVMHIIADPRGGDTKRGADFVKAEFKGLQ